MIHLILVRFDTRLRGSLPESILQKFDSIEEVWTSDNRGQTLENLNECFEFSGYQEGINRFVNLNKGDAVGYKDTNHHALIFANDTIFSGHHSGMRDFMIESLVNLATQKSNTFSVTGLGMPLSNELQTLTGLQSYFSSWLFMIEGSLEQLERVRFYPQGLQLDLFAAKIEPRLPSPYRHAIEDWLHPKSLTGGWYKASFRNKLPPNVIQRKRFTIYLELMLPQYLQSQGLACICISERINKTSQLFLKWLRLLDRVHVNLLKLSLRFL